MKQFNLKEYLANPSRKVVTRDGRRARIVSTDMRCENYPIVALVQISDKYPTEEINTYTENGKLDFEHPYKDDLFFAPETHEGWVNVYKEGTNRYLEGCICVTKEEAKRIRGYGYVTTIKIEWEE